MGIYSKKHLESQDYFEKLNKHTAESMKSKVVKAGHYQLLETDAGGMRDLPQGILYLMEDLTEYELAKRLFEKYGYYNAWGGIQYEVYKPEPQYLI